MPLLPFRKHTLICIAGGASLAALLAVWSLRLPFIDAAEAELAARKIHWSQVLGTRMPCRGMLDIGVTVIFKNSEEGELIGGRLCRRLGWSSEWKWYPDPGNARPGVRARDR